MKGVPSLTTARKEQQRLVDNPLVRGFLVFSAFRAVYGTGILVVTYLLATSETTPYWTSFVFLAFSMVFSRWLFRKLKKRWPGLFKSHQHSDDTQSDQTTP